MALAELAGRVGNQVLRRGLRGLAGSEGGERDLVPGQPVQTVRPHKKETDQSHTSVWLDAEDERSPMDMVFEERPIPWEDTIVACWGGGDPKLGHPIEYIKLDDCTEANPAICKYCGLRYYHSGSHH